MTFSGVFRLCITVLLGTLIYPTTGQQCLTENIKKILPNVYLDYPGNPQWIFYGITQDCQLYFARSDQLDQIQYLKIQTLVTNCLPHLVQLHWTQLHHHGMDGSNLALQLVFKKSQNQICTLLVEFPSKSALSGYSIFTYSVLSSINYAACSLIVNSTFNMEPNLSFMDTSFADVIYFVDPGVRGSSLTLNQFKIESSGYLRSMETFKTNNFALKFQNANSCPMDYVWSLDAQRHRLYAIHKEQKAVAVTCLYDLVFRPAKAVTQFYEPLRFDSPQFSVESMSVDGAHILISESQRHNERVITKLFLLKKHREDATECILQLPFLTEVFLISLDTKGLLETNHLPHFSNHKKKKHNQNQTHSAGSMQSTPRPVPLPHKSARVTTTSKAPYPQEGTTTSTAHPPATTTAKTTRTTTKRTTTTTTSEFESEEEIGDGRILESEEIEPVRYSDEIIDQKTTEIHDVNEDDQKAAEVLYSTEELKNSEFVGNATSGSMKIAPSKHSLFFVITIIALLNVHPF